jgi:cytochrome c-type biogenesis protein CcmH/NrfG
MPPVAALESEMTIGGMLAAVAVAMIALVLWVARQARIVCEEVQARRIAMEVADREEEQEMRKDSARLRRRSRRRMY